MTVAVYLKRVTKIFFSIQLDFKYTGVLKHKISCVLGTLRGQTVVSPALSHLV